MKLEVTASELRELTHSTVASSRPHTIPELGAFLTAIAEDMNVLQLATLAEFLGRYADMLNDAVLNTLPKPETTPAPTAEENDGGVP